jgi:predicted alpha/beta superfamily hydrolase
MMMRHFRLFLNLLFLLPISLWGQLLIEVSNLPSTTPPGSDIYIAGSFNDWSPDNTDYILAETSPGIYQIELDIAAGTYEFKFTRGSWPTVEGTTNGTFRPNRQITYSGGQQTASLIIDGWEGLSSGGSTAAPNVEILSNSFYMPQLNRNRRIWVYLPPDYYTSSREYPVLYMHDAQNLFDQATSFGGEWEVDESLNDLFNQGDPGIIVIGIENGGGERINELTPWANSSYGGGDGAAYVDFIVETLKPYVDNNYRTKSDQPNTGIMGSSLGGLISLYACIRHQDIFGKAGILSPSLWFTDDIYDFVSSTGKQAQLKIALVAGEQESSTMVAELQAMYNTLLSAGFSSDELLITTHADGEHSEWYWRREFPGTYQWLFQIVSILQGSLELNDISYWPNPGTDYLFIDGLPATTSSWQMAIYNTGGQKIKESSFSNAQIDVSTLPSGSYFIVIWNDNEGWSIVNFQKNR